MKPAKPTLLIAMASLLACLSTAQDEPPRTLKIGMDAPALTFGKSLKGTAVSKIEKGKVYVIEAFTWWGQASQRSLSAMNDLAKAYAGKAEVQGVCVLFPDQPQAEKFFTDAGDHITFNVALDTDASKDKPSGTFAKTWMEASGFTAPPTIFIVDQDGKLAWAGQVAAIDDPLKQIIDKKWDRDAFAAKVEKNEFSPLSLAIRKANGLVENQQFDEALTVVDKIETMAPIEAVTDPKLLAATMRLDILINGKHDETGWYVAARKAADGAMKSDGPSLNNIAWEVVDPKGQITNKDKDFALKCALQAVELTKHQDGNILDTLAWTYALIGDRPKAIAAEKEALKCKLDDDTRKKFEENLKTLKGED